MNKVTRTDLFTHDLVHDNPGLVKYESSYNDPAFLKARDYDGKTFDLYNCAQYGLLWDGFAEKHGKAPVFPEGSESRAWVLKKREELKKLYSEMVDAGIQVSFMMDCIVLPAALVEMMPEILNEKGKIDIKKPLTKQIIEDLFDEMFETFPQIHGIYIRYGETYTGPRYSLDYYTGNNPIQGDAAEYHVCLIEYLKAFVCEKHNREVYYRSWGASDVQHSKDTYLNICERIQPDPRFYFCIKHTTGDFHRCTVFNQSLNCGQHQQVVEVQAAREYEGKGAYPNYVADGVINGFEELKWVMHAEQNQSLRDIVNVENSKIVGIWTWSRGGGWDGPYINGCNGKHGEVVVKNGSELWCDLNAYVISQWAKDTGKSDRYYAQKYATDVLQMSEKDSRIFYEICLLSSRAVLHGRGCNTEKLRWEEYWTRDQNVDPGRFYKNVSYAVETNNHELLLWEKHRSVEFWKEIVALAESITTGEQLEFIRVSCKYGYYLYAIYESMYRANVNHLLGNHEAVRRAVDDYEKLWSQWQQLKEDHDCCPTLYIKEDVQLDLIGYSRNRGFDSVMKFEL